MPTERFVLVGAGGHAKVVMDALLCARGNEVDAHFADDNPALIGKLLLGRVVRVPVPRELAHGERVHIAIGDNRVRQYLLETMANVAGGALSIVHPAAIVSQFAELADGVFVAATAVVAPAARIGRGVIVNHGAIVDHDCSVGAFSHIAPASTLGGGAQVGSRVLIGAGAVLMPGVKVADDAVVGAGAVVISDVAAGDVVVGVPAGPMQEGRK